MNILAIETTGATASVAIIDEEGRIFEEASTEKLNHLQFLMPMVGKALEKSQLQIGDITAIAASEGPGSFTGIRIGVSSARALAQALDIKCINVPTLQSFLYNIPTYEGLFCPIFDARRSQIYGGAYRWSQGSGDGAVQELIEGNAYTLDEFLERLRECVEKPNGHTDIKEAINLGRDGIGKGILFFGDGVETYQAAIEEWQRSSLKGDIQDISIHFADKAVRFQKATSIARLALALYKQGKCCDYNELEPNYMRKAEAERKLDEANAKTKSDDANVIQSDQTEKR